MSQSPTAEIHSHGMNNSKKTFGTFHVSFAVDAKSVIDTIKIVLSEEGSVAEDGGSRCEFIGTADPDHLYDPEGNYMKIKPLDR